MGELPFPAVTIGPAGNVLTYSRQTRSFHNNICHFYGIFLECFFRRLIKPLGYGLTEGTLDRLPRTVLNMLHFDCRWQGISEGENCVNKSANLKKETDFIWERAVRQKFAERLSDAKRIAEKTSVEQVHGPMFCESVALPVYRSYFFDFVSAVELSTKEEVQKLALEFFR